MLATVVHAGPTLNLQIRADRKEVLIERNGTLDGKPDHLVPAYLLFFLVRTPLVVVAVAAAAAAAATTNTIYLPLLLGLVVLLQLVSCLLTSSDTPLKDASLDQ